MLREGDMVGIWLLVNEEGWCSKVHMADVGIITEMVG